MITEFYYTTQQEFIERLTNNRQSQVVTLTVHICSVYSTMGVKQLVARVRLRQLRLVNPLMHKVAWAPDRPNVKTKNHGLGPAGMSLNPIILRYHLGNFVH